MDTTQFLKARVSPETKRRVQEAAEQQLITESIWLRRSIDASLRACSSDKVDISKNEKQRIYGTRLSIRLRSEDRLFLKERATARGMAPATYVSVLTRAHLRKLPPLPKEELTALKRSVAELGAIGRNLNQLARAANHGGRLAGPGRDDLRAMLKVCEGLRDHLKELIRSNTASWESGHA